MKAPDDQGGVRIKCMQCSVTLEIPYLRGILVDVPPEQATQVVGGVTVPKAGSGPHVIAPKFGSAPGVVRPSTSRESRTEEWLREAGERKDANDIDAAIRLLQRAYEEIKREGSSFPVDTFLRLPLYLQQAGRGKEAWHEFTRLLFHGYANQSKDPVRVAQDRARILEKMRLFLDRDSRNDAGGIYGLLSQLFEGIALVRDNRKREALARFNKTACQEMVAGLTKYTGNLGALQEIRSIIIEELNRWPDLELERLANRLDTAFAAHTP
jgi:hypothetical protein